MMKAKVVDIKRFAVHDGDGIRTTVFLKGCPLRCIWCHNPESIEFEPQIAYYKNKCLSCGDCAENCPVKVHSFTSEGHFVRHSLCIGCGKCENVCLNNALKLYGRTVTVEEVMALLIEDKDFYDHSGGGVTLSGGECLMQYEFCTELLKRLKAEKIHTAIDTCGFVSKEAIDSVMPYTDIFLYDIKAYDDEVHIKCTGQSNKIILENLKYIDDCGKDIEIRIPYVPEYNSNQFEKIAEFLTQFKNITKVRVLPYHNFAGSKYEALGMENTLPVKLPQNSEIEDAARILKDNGLCVAE